MQQGKTIDGWQEGYYCLRHRKYKLDVPVRVWLQDGDRDEFGELESDQIWCAAWAPNPNSTRFYRIAMTYDLWVWLAEIDKDEFEWLMTLKNSSPRK